MTKISSLTALTGAGVDTAADLLAIVDMSLAGAARNKKITIAELGIALQAIIDARVAAGSTGLLDFKGSTDCSANPNYPAASKGDFYVVSVAGKIGGASGTVVEVGDAYFAEADNAGGTQAAVGTDWSVIQANIVGGTITELDDVPDVNAPSPSNGDVLTWDSTPGEWTPQPLPGAGAFVIDDATDVDTTSTPPNDGDVLTFDTGSGDWIPAAGDLGALHLQDQRVATTDGGTFTSGAWQPRVLNTEVINTISGASHVISTVTITIASPGVVSWTAHGLAAGTPIVFSTTGALPTGLTAGTVYFVLAPNANDFTVSATSGGAAINTSGSQSGVHTARSNRFTLAAGTYDIWASAPAIQVDNHTIRLQNLTDASTTFVGTLERSRGASTSDGTCRSMITGRFVIAGTKTFDLEHRCETTVASAGFGEGTNNTWAVCIYADVFIKRVA